jgi:hypothetical protein
MEGFRRFVILEDGTGVGSGEFAGASHDGLEHRVQIESRAECAPDIAERPKFAHRARQGLGPRFELLEQPDVLDGDHRLGGKGLEQSDLTVGERPGRAARHGHRPNRPTITKQRDGDDAPIAACAGDSHLTWRH